MAVPYVDLAVIGEVADPERPTGPLGGLGPLPVLHRQVTVDVDLSRFEFGMTDGDILTIVEGLRDRQVAVIEAGTGTGKSTFMPFRLMNPPAGAQFRLADYGPIVVTEPRRAAATGVARFVGEELCFGHDSRVCDEHVGPGFPVGHQVSGEKNWDGACELIYVTDGTMINWMRDGSLARIGAVIVDEAHERSENIDIILAQLRDKVRQYKHLRVIITSATLDRNFFVEYFGGPEHVFHHQVPSKKAFGYGIPLFPGVGIDDAAIAGGASFDASGGSGPTVTFDGWARWGPEQPDQQPEDLHDTTRALQALRCVEETPIERWRERMPAAVATQVLAIAAGTEWGDILGFLPTSETIGDAVQRIIDGLGPERAHFDVYPLLATTDKPISEKAIAARSRGDKRKIVISSNLAETSLTVKGVRFVVDSGLICQAEWDPSIASGSYPTKAHSQSGLRQRWGRVGRDAPGWVFPLYTPQQFLGLPKNTPPGSTQTNLETFYMKLISAGVDVDGATLPANFVHPNVAYDAEALKNAASFTTESVRAKRALAMSGAVDRDGHLTEFGRDLERFPGDGSEALALMLADQLACAHEVALALHVLGEGSLYGHGDTCILRSSKDWPAAWRVTAAQRHRALAVGCSDDLDVLFRIFALWQASDEPTKWCSTWWVNEPALAAGEEAMMTVVDSLSAAMKGAARRPILPTLAEKARGVLSRAMATQRYERISGVEFRPTGADDGETVVLSQNQLVESGNRVLAFKRFRPPAASDGSRSVPIVSHTVRVADWAEATGPASDDLGIDLIVRAAGNCADTAGDIGDPLAAVRERFPVGTIVHLELDDAIGSDSRIRKLLILRTTFALPGDEDLSIDNMSRRVPPSGFDSEWDPRTALSDEVPEEEVALRLLDPRSLEANDGGKSAGTVEDETGVGEVSLEPRSPAPPKPTLYAVPAFSSVQLPRVTSAVVTGYQLSDGQHVALAIDPLNSDVGRYEPVSDVHADAPLLNTLRVEDLVREFAMSYDDTATMLRELDIVVRSHFTKLTDEQVARAREHQQLKAMSLAELEQELTRLESLSTASDTALVKSSPVELGADPALHADCAYGDEIVLEMRGEVRDHDRAFYELVRNDGGGVFYLDASAEGLGAFDRGYLGRLRVGSLVVGTMVADDANPFTVTLLPSLRDGLDEVSIDSQESGDGTPASFRPSTVITMPDRWGKVVVELDHADAQTGLSHRFEVPARHLNAAGVENIAVGRRVLVALEPDRDRKRLALDLGGDDLVRYGIDIDDLRVLLRLQREYLSGDGRTVRAARPHLPEAVARHLATLSGEAEWQKTVWAFYADNLHMVVSDARPWWVRTHVECPSTIASLLRVRKREVQERLDIRVSVDASGTQLELLSNDTVEAETARRSVGTLVASPRVSASLPPGTAGLVVGKDQVNRKRIESIPGIEWMWLDGDRVGVIGTTSSAVKRAIEDIQRLVSTATLELVVPPGKSGLLIGKGGATIRQLTVASGCRANKTADGDKWIVEGPSETAVNTFVQLASARVSGVRGRIVNARHLTIVEDTASSINARTSGYSGGGRAARAGESEKQKTGCAGAVLLCLLVPTALLTALIALL